VPELRRGFNIGPARRPRGEGHILSVEAGQSRKRDLSGPASHTKSPGNCSPTQTFIRRLVLPLPNPHKRQFIAVCEPLLWSKGSPEDLFQVKEPAPLRQAITKAGSRRETGIDPRSAHDRYSWFSIYLHIRWSRRES
jgi:hypothetical protein